MAPPAAVMITDTEVPELLAALRRRTRTTSSSNFGKGQVDSGVDSEVVVDLKPSSCSSSRLAPAALSLAEEQARAEAQEDAALLADPNAEVAPDTPAAKHPESLPVPVGPQLAWLDPYLIPLLVDPRDTVFVKTSMWLSIGVLSALYLVLVQFTWVHFALHAAWVAKYATTFVLMLHCVCHRPLYRRTAPAPLHWWVPYFLAPFYGHTWETFYWHHIKHHHIEDNGPNDLSCTLHYQRDNFFHFLHYFFRFLLFTPIELTLYFARKGWYSSALRLACMEAGSWVHYATLTYLGMTYGYNTSVVPGLMTLVLPVVLMRFGMMSGNWAQHAFVDATRADCDYVQSLTCIDNHYNAIAFNDGYHTSHHLHPRRHWADHPANLVTHAREYGKQGTIVFRGIDFHETWWLLMTKNYDRLAKCYVHMDLDSPRPAQHEIVALLKDRTRRMSDQEIAKYYSPEARAARLAKAN
ncbi:hypothetical protein GGF32_006045 [Allomyces javanicus]|nr:hypothetical protein GGF32_006045 [Allomyces javanicus]